MKCDKCGEEKIIIDSIESPVSNEVYHNYECPNNCDYIEWNTQKGEMKIEGN